MNNIPQASTKDTTIALGVLQDDTVVRAINAEAPPGVDSIFGAIQAPNKGPTGHAERFLFDTYGSQLKMIAVSQAPCPACRRYLKGRGIDVYYEKGRYVPGIK